MSASVEIAGRKITLKRVKVKNLGVVCAATEPFIDAFDQAVERDLKKSQAFEATTLFKLVTRHTDHFVRLCALLSDADEDWINELEPHELFELAQHIISHSADFFLTQIAEPLAKLQKQIVDHCLTLSRNSLATATPKKPS